MDPETVPWTAIAGQERQGFAGRSGGAEPMDLIAVDNQRAWRERLTATAFAIGSITAGEHGHVVIADQRPPALDVANDAWAATGCEGEVAR